MIIQSLKLNEIPMIKLGNDSKKVYLFIHGKHGNKEEAENFASIAEKKGWQTLAIDLPGHGERKNSIADFIPQVCIPEIARLYDYASSKFKSIAIRANSIGAYFSMLALNDREIQNSLFVSPIINMKKLINGMMQALNIDEKTLEQKGRIDTPFDETLDWEYYCFAKSHPVEWKKQTSILCADKDALTSIDDYVAFSKKHGTKLQVLNGGEHWFHTQSQLLILNSWLENEI